MHMIIWLYELFSWHLKLIRSCQMIWIMHVFFTRNCAFSFLHSTNYIVEGIWTSSYVMTSSIFVECTVSIIYDHLYAISFSTASSSIILARRVVTGLCVAIFVSGIQTTEAGTNAHPNDITEVHLEEEEAHPGLYFPSLLSLNLFSFSSHVCTLMPARHRRFHLRIMLCEIGTMVYPFRNTNICYFPAACSIYRSCFSLQSRALCCSHIFS